VVATGRKTVWREWEKGGAQPLRQQYPTCVGKDPALPAAASGRGPGPWPSGLYRSRHAKEVASIVFSRRYFAAGATPESGLGRRPIFCPPGAYAGALQRLPPGVGVGWLRPACSVASVLTIPRLLRLCRGQRYYSRCLKGRCGVSTSTRPRFFATLKKNPRFGRRLGRASGSLPNFDH